jgi:hypothetical protein
LKPGTVTEYIHFLNFNIFSTEQMLELLVFNGMVWMLVHGILSKMVLTISMGYLLDNRWRGEWSDQWMS